MSAAQGRPDFVADKAIQGREEQTPLAGTTWTTLTRAVLEGALRQVAAQEAERNQAQTTGVVKSCFYDWGAGGVWLDKEGRSGVGAVESW